MGRLRIPICALLGGVAACGATARQAPRSEAHDLSARESPPSADTALSFNAALELAAKNLATPSGKSFEVEALRSVGQDMANAMRSCFRSVDEPDRRDFRVLLKLSSSGAVTESVVQPSTNVSLCFSRALRFTVFSQPPFDGYWLQVAMTIAP